MKATFTIIIALIFINVKAQAPDWGWAKSAGGIGGEYGESIISDAFGNVYLTGYYGSSSITFGTSTLINAGITDIFIVKYDVSGNILWVKGAGSTGYDQAHCITTDASGNVYVTGSFDGSITFGTTTLTSSGGEDIFIVKYDAFGNVVWAISNGSTGSENGLSIITDASNNVYCTGSYDSDITFGTTTLTNVGARDMFIVKYDVFGNVIWANGAGTASDDITHGITIDSFGNVCVTGHYAYFPITFGSFTLPNAGAYDIFIVKYDALGNIMWAKGEGSPNTESSSSITSDAFGNLYVSGYYNSTTITFGTNTFTSAGGDDMFIIKYDSLGSVIWAKSVGGVGTDYILGTCVDISGNVYLTGSYTSSIITFGGTTLNNVGGRDIYIAKYDAFGNLLWVKTVGSTGADYAQSTTIDAFGNIYITGSYASPSVTFGATTLTNSGTSDMYIAKLDNTTVTIEKNTLNHTIDIYPNPNSGTFTIQNSNLKILRCAIKNVLGENIFIKQSNLTNQINIDLSAQAKGIYFVETTDENKNVSNTKIIIQ